MSNLFVFLSISLCQGGEPPKGAYVEKLKPQNPYDIEGNDIDKGGSASKACRYDDAKWSDCDPFEMIRFRTLRLVSGGRQCEEVKNVTKHCSAEELPPGTKWLIAEHRKCIAELKKLKYMIADLAKYITTLREKGQKLFNSYLALKKHLEELRYMIERLQRENSQKKQTIAKIREDMEEWKTKARTLQSQLDELKSKYHDLEREHKEMGEKQKECKSEKQRCKIETERLNKKIHDLEAINSELKRRLMDAEKYKDQLKEATEKITKLEFVVEKLTDKLEIIKDDVSQCKLDMLNANSVQEQERVKDTHMDLNMEMWITHNKSQATYYTHKYTYPTTTYPSYKKYAAKCLVSYYGITNETCWYNSKRESGEADYADTLGQHLVEAHWKYFTIDVKDQYECDKAAQLHYEFLLNRCQPKHYLPVLSMYRPDETTPELDTHIYPKTNIPQPGQYNRCWITFLGPHGHCERRMEKYSLYNTDDTPQGYKAGSGTSKHKCLYRAKTWADYCETPVIASYLPDGKSSNWKDEDIQHDSHGGRMFEEQADVRNKINPESYKPHELKRPEPKQPEEYEDTPEFRQSLNMQGAEKEAVLRKLRERLGMKSKKANVGPGSNPKVKWHGAKGEHGTHNGPNKGEAYATLSPSLSAANLHV